MKIHFLALLATLSGSAFAQVATINPPKQKLKWDDMDLGPFFSGCYRVKDSTSFKGVAVAVGTKESPATILFDPELLRFHAAWEGGLAAFSRGRGGLEGVIGSDGPVSVSTGWMTGIGKELIADPREKHQGNISGLKWKGIHVSGPNTVLEYAVGKQQVLEMPSSAVKEGVRVYTRTIMIGAGSDVKELLVADGRGAKIEGGSTASVEVNGVVSRFVLSGAPTGAKFFVRDGVLGVQFAEFTSPTTFQIAFASAPTADAAKLSAVDSNAKIPNIASMLQPGASRWGAAVVTQGKLGEAKDGYATDDITLPDENPYKSWMRPGGHDFFPD